MGSGVVDTNDAERTRKPRPRSAGPTSDWNRRWSAYPRTFSVRAEQAPSDKQALFFGPKHSEYREKIAKLLEDDFAARKQEAERQKDGAYRRKVAEAHMGSKNMKPASAKSLF